LDFRNCGKKGKLNLKKSRIRKNAITQPNEIKINKTQITNLDDF
jgi:hypothetical protein